MLDPDPDEMNADPQPWKDLHSIFLFFLQVYKELRPILVQMLTDPSEQPVVRTAVSSALTGLCFVGGGEIAEVLNIMNVLEAIFTQSVPRK
jgi:hypothetical protein